MAGIAFAPALPAVHPPLAAFLQNLNTDIAAGTSTSFLTALGRRLVLGHVLQEKEFPKSGTPSPADLGLLTNSLHGLAGLVPWGGVATNVADEIAVFNCHFPSIRTGSALHI